MPPNYTHTLFPLDPHNTTLCNTERKPEHNVITERQTEQEVYTILTM